jgi:hypothetical protein
MEVNAKAFLVGWTSEACNPCLKNGASIESLCQGHKFFSLSLWFLCEENKNESNLLGHVQQLDSSGLFEST